MDRRTRNRICIWVIFVGLLNLVAYTVVYAELGGDARNGYIGESESGQREYYVGGHFLQDPTGAFRPVAPWVWIYSYAHSISIWPTEAAILVCLLILARPHIVATMKEDSLMPGSTVVTVCITIILLLASTLTAWFTIQFVAELAG